MTRPMIDDNGVIRPMTDEEIKSHEQQTAQSPLTAPTPEERISKLETENAYLKEALELILSGETGV